MVGKKPGAAREAQLQDLAFAEQAGADMRPYDRLIGAALDGRRMLFASRTRSRQPGESSSRCSVTHVPVYIYGRGSWGPKEADDLLPDGESWHDPAG